jgi:hypothetical protein
VITEVDIVLPQVEQLGADRLARHQHLQVTGAVAERGEADPTELALQQHAPGDRHDAPGAGVGRELSGLLTDRGKGVGPRRTDRVRLGPAEEALRCLLEADRRCTRSR